MSQMLKASGLLGAATMTSRVLGMVREMVYARFMGDTWVAGAFVLAFQIPNLFRRLLGEGALTAAFIPIFKEKERGGDPAQMWRVANAVLSGLVVAAGVLIGVVTLGLTLTLALAGDAFLSNTQLMLELLRLMFPYLLLVCVASVFIGMLNARNYFFVPALGATMLNVVMIASVLWVAPRWGVELHEQVRALAWGVLAAGVAQALFQLPALWRQGYRPQWVSPWRNEAVREVARRIIPGTIGVAAFQINVLMTQTLSYGVDPTIVASFGYAVRLLELPQGVIGISFATYLLPTLAGLAADKQYPEFRRTVSEGMGYVFFINLLASVFLILLAEPIIRLLFERGRFDAAATGRAAFALACLGPSLVAYSLVNLQARAFFALGDTRTPMHISLFCLGLNLALALLLVFPFKQGGLGMAATLSATANCLLLRHALRRKLGRDEVNAWEGSLRALLTLAAGAGVVAWAAWQLWEQHLGHATLWFKAGAVFVPMILATAAYFGLALWLNLGAARQMRAFFAKASKDDPAD